MLSIALVLTALLISPMHGSCLPNTVSRQSQLSFKHTNTIYFLEDKCNMRTRYLCSHRVLSISLNHSSAIV